MFKVSENPARSKQILENEVQFISSLIKIACVEPSREPAARCTRLRVMQVNRFWFGTTACERRMRMDEGLYIELDKDIPGLPVPGAAVLFEAVDGLTDAAESLGVRPLCDFFGMDPEEVNPIFAAEGFEIELPRGFEQWYTPEEGLETVRALLREAETSREVRAAKEVLLICQRVLEAAKEQGARWHFGVTVDPAE